MAKYIVVVIEFSEEALEKGYNHPDAIEKLIGELLGVEGMSIKAVYPHVDRELIFKSALIGDPSALKELVGE